ncbi:hypothetical protein ABZ863_14955 [Saccharomonospora sp. NPDC046836]|uniref:hypothetical protein n=1 Tax=Saccharomonospora sp. NPDC046836 TaxID=3156921 RepID=UPI0034017D97
MILPDRIAHAVAAGDVTVAYRRWRKPRVRAGATFRTVAGIVRIDSIEQVDSDRLGDPEARAAGYDSGEKLKATFRGEPDDPVYRIALSCGGPDSRKDIAADDDLTPDDIAEIDALLDRLDAREPWARATMNHIAEEPGITAGALADRLPIGKESLKRRIRTLKEHGLTRSQPAGYLLSARGRAYLAASVRGSAPAQRAE